MPSATGSTRNVRRWIVWVAVLLLAGALINATVAWGFALWTRAGAGKPSLNDGARPWPTRVPDDWPRPAVLDAVERPGLRGEVFTAALGGDLGATRRHSYCVIAARSGWPLPSMGWTYWLHTAGAPSKEVTTGLPPRTSWWHWGMPIPKWMGAKVQLWQRFPVRPIPLPFLANSLFYAAVLGAPVLGVAALWKRLRRKPGHCGRCGYDLRNLPAGVPCPECGAEAIGG